MLYEIRNMFGRLFIVFAYFPFVLFRRLTVLVGIVQVVVLQVTFGRFATFALYFLCGLEDRFAQRASDLTGCRVPGIVDGRAPTLFAFLRDCRVRRDWVLGVLTRQDRWEEVASAQPCVDCFIRGLGRRLVLHRRERVIFDFVFVSKFRVNFRVNRGTSRRAAQGPQDSGREIRRAVLQASMGSGGVVRGFLGRTACFRMHLRVCFECLRANVFRRDLCAGRVNVANAPKG